MRVERSVAGRDLAASTHSAPDRSRVLSPAGHGSDLAQARWARVAGLVVLYLSWGSTYMAMRVALRVFPPLLLLGARCFLAGIILFLIARARGAAFPSRAEIVNGFGIAVLVLVLGHGLVTWGIQYVPSGVAAILVSVVPAWMALVAWRLLRESPSRRAVTGLVTGFAGLLLVVGASANGGVRLVGVGALLLAPICWAIGSIMNRRAQLPRDPLLSAAIQLMAAAPVLALAGVAGGEPARLHLGAITWETIAAFFYLVVVGYVVGFGVYTWLLQVAPIPTVSTYAYVNPLVAVALGFAFLGEHIKASTLVGGFIILSGVAMIVLDRAQRSRWPVAASASDRGVL